MRHDGGDAETGVGLEVGAGLGFTTSAVTAEARVRGVLAHQAPGFREWGASGSLRIDPGADGRGLSLTLAPSVGVASSGTGRLWSAADAREFAPDGTFAAQQRLDAEVGYGLAAGHGTATPYAGVGLADGGARAWRAGVRWQVSPAASLDLEGTHHESDGGEPEQSLALRGLLRW